MKLKDLSTEDGNSSFSRFTSSSGAVSSFVSIGALALKILGKYKINGILSLSGK